MPQDHPSFKEFNEALGRISQLESNLQKNVDQTNKALMSAKNSDGNLEKRINELETRLNQTRDHLNVILQKAKDYDSGLDRRLASVESSLKDVERDKRGSGNANDNLSKRDISSLIDSTTKGLERDLNRQIGDLRKMVDGLSRSAKR